MQTWGALGLWTDGMCGLKICFLNHTLIVQQKSAKIIPLQCILPKIFNPFSEKMGQKFGNFGQNIQDFLNFLPLHCISTLFSTLILQCILDILKNILLGSAHTRRSFCQGGPRVCKYYYNMQAHAQEIEFRNS